jgi:hypothetical protein
MRRKNRRWVATAAVLYLFVMYSAYRWSIAQRPTDGPILEHIQNEEVRKFKERSAREAQEQAQAQSQPPGARLSASGPAFVAARYDAARVVFIVATDTESRFSTSPFSRFLRPPAKIPAPAKPAAPLAGLDELWEPDSNSLHFFPEIVQQTHPGDRWILSLSSDATIPVVIERAVIAPTGCSLGIGFLATVPPDQQAVYAASGREYFLVRHAPVESADPPLNSHIVELSPWNPLPAYAQQIEQQLNQRMMQEDKAIDLRLIANANSPGAAGELPVGNARPLLKEWLHADRGLALGKGVLDYDVHSYRLTPDGVPRLFVRARWKLAGTPVFLITAWFKADTQPVLLSSDASWSEAMREGDAPASLGDRLDFQTILNEFDADHDGWAELLIHSYDAHSPQGGVTTIAPYLYTDKGLVTMKMPLRRDAQSLDSCIDP